jgi:hypothetical protein
VSSLDGTYSVQRNRPTITYDFDLVCDWGPLLSAHLGAVIPSTAATTIRQRRPKYIEDAAEILLADIYPNQTELVSRVSKWIQSQTVAAYHGSRLTESEIENIRSRGLVTLDAEDRKKHLCEKLSRHPSWPLAAKQLDSVIHDLGKKQKGGKREGQAHATLSRVALAEGFNHYLTHGSEFDQHAAHFLLGDEGKALLAAHGQPTLFTLAVPGSKAFEAANPFLILVQDMPNLVRETIRVWAHWLANPDFSVTESIFDCGLIFNHDIPPEWITCVESLSVGSPEYLR